MITIDISEEVLRHLFSGKHESDCRALVGDEGFADFETKDFDSDRWVMPRLSHRAVFLLNTNEVLQRFILEQVAVVKGDAISALKDGAL